MSTPCSVWRTVQKTATLTWNILKTLRIHNLMMTSKGHHPKLDRNCHLPGEAQNHLPWCKCGNCRRISQDIENVCCKKRRCIKEQARFQKVCLDADVLELCIKNRADIRNDRKDNSAKTFRKAAYRQFILDKYGYLGKSRTKVAPSCVVWCVRHHYPSSTGLYMGFRSH